MQGVIIDVLFFRTNKTTSTKEVNKPEKRRGKSVLDCGKPVSSCVVDHLPSVLNRNSYPHVPEPEVAMIFRTKGSTEVDMNQLELQLKSAKKEVILCLQFTLFCVHCAKTI